MFLIVFSSTMTLRGRGTACSQGRLLESNWWRLPPCSHALCTETTQLPRHCCFFCFFMCLANSHSQKRANQCNWFSVWLPSLQGYLCQQLTFSVMQEETVENSWENGSSNRKWKKVLDVLQNSHKSSKTIIYKLCLKQHYVTSTATHFFEKRNLIMHINMVHRTKIYQNWVIFYIKNVLWFSLWCSTTALSVCSLLILAELSPATRETSMGP